jgi:hypothetical protein
VTPYGDNMASPILTLTAVESGLGFLLTGAILYLVLSRGRKAYHYLFAAFLLLCAIWDLGVFLLMIRNQHVDELELIGRVIWLVCAFIPVLIFHFACRYTGRPLRWAIALGWGITGVLFLLTFAGLYGRIEGVYTYSWGSIFRSAPSVLDPLAVVLWLVLNLSACWLLFKATRRATSVLERRHHLYILAGLLAITFAVVKVGVVMGVNIPILLPLGMLLVDAFNAIIGTAIIKDRLFDITLIIKKSALYSVLAGLLIFIYSFLEHLFVTYLGETIGESSATLHLISIAVGIAVLMPVKNRLERVIGGYFADRKLQF